MQAMAIIVLGQLITLPVELELAVGDPVAIATDQGAIVIVRELDILLDVVVTQHDVCQFPVAVGYHDRYQAAAPVGDAGFGAFFSTYRAVGLPSTSDTKSDGFKPESVFVSSLVWLSAFSPFPPQAHITQSAIAA